VARPPLLQIHMRPGPATVTDGVGDALVDHLGKRAIGVGGIIETCARGTLADVDGSDLVDALGEASHAGRRHERLEVGGDPILLRVLVVLVHPNALEGAEVALHDEHRVLIAPPAQAVDAGVRRE